LIARENFTLIYTHPNSGNTISLAPNQILPKKKGDYIYFIRLFPCTPALKIYYKIGTTNRVIDRLKEHLRSYKFNYHIDVLWISPTLAKYTTLRIEDRQKTWWKEFPGWEYIPNDRFIIPSNVTDITIKIRKEYHILI